MNKNLKKVFVCSAIMVASLFTVSMISVPKQASVQQPLSPPESRPPEQVVYSAFFHFVVDLQKQAGELESEGKKGESLRGYVQKETGLSDEEAAELSEISAACVEAVSQQDAKALLVIQQFQAQFPGGKVPRGVKLPPPPPELKALQEERDQMILSARNQLVSVLGETVFGNLERFAKSRVAINRTR
jgi:hypothetical protein